MHGLGIVAFITAWITVVITGIVYLVNDNPKDREEVFYRRIAKVVGKLSAKVCVVAMIVIIVTSPLSSTEKTYKNILFYRGINSNNAAEIMDSTARILKFAEQYIEGKVDQ